MTKIKKFWTDKSRVIKLTSGVLMVGVGAGLLYYSGYKRGFIEASRFTGKQLSLFDKETGKTLGKEFIEWGIRKYL